MKLVVEKQDHSRVTKWVFPDSITLEQAKESVSKEVEKWENGDGENWLEFAEGDNVILESGDESFLLTHEWENITQSVKGFPTPDDEGRDVFFPITDCSECSCHWDNMSKAEREELDKLGWGADCSHELPTWKQQNCPCFQKIGR